MSQVLLTEMIAKREAALVEDTLARTSRADSCKSADTDPSALREVLTSIDDPLRVSAVLLHGSWARQENDAASDVDVVVIARWGCYAEETLHFGPIDVDMCRGSLTALIRRMRSRYPFNNNFVLNALLEARMCVDRDGWGEFLKGEAKKLWECGPPAIAIEEKAAARKALQKLVLTTQRLTRRSQSSGENQTITGIRCDQIFVTATYLYYQLAGQWTTSFPQLLRRIKLERPDLHRLWNEYVAASTIPHKVGVAAQYAEGIQREHETQ